jgi:hypothetical protein
MRFNIKNKLIFALVIFLTLIFLISFVFIAKKISFFDYKFFDRYFKNQKLNQDQLIEKIKKELIQNRLIEEENLKNLRVEKEIDLTGDGLPEILIDLGSGGAAIENYILLTLIDNQPQLLRFKKKSDEIDYLIFSQGTGGAGRYGLMIEFLPQENAIYQASYSAYNLESDYCQVSYYKYNQKKKIFEYNLSLSNQYQRIYCQKICQNIPQELKNYFQKICQ